MAPKLSLEWIQDLGTCQRADPLLVWFLLGTVHNLGASGQTAETILDLRPVGKRPRILLLSNKIVVLGFAVTDLQAPNKTKVPWASSQDVGKAVWRVSNRHAGGRTGHRVEKTPILGGSWPEWLLILKKVIGGNFRMVSD